MTDTYSINGSPRDRGECDAYYDRGCSPHYYNEDDKRVTKEDMTPEQIEEYVNAYNTWVELGLCYEP
jgi:hypothetical protein